MWYLTGFSGVRASFLLDINGTLDSTHLLTSIKDLQGRIYSERLSYAPKYDGDILAGVATLHFSIG